MSLINRCCEVALDAMLARSQKFQDYINNRFDKRDFWVTTDTGLKFYLNHELPSIYAIYHEYKLDDIRPDDVVLDIGANIGSVSMLLAKTAKHVFAYEPLYTDYLISNIKLNEIYNITISERGLGHGLVKLRYGCRSKDVWCVSFQEMIADCRLQSMQPTFLKIDVEGAEWGVTYSELKPFRRIEGEIHHCNRYNYNDFLYKLRLAGFVYEFEVLADGQVIFHAWK